MRNILAIVSLSGLLVATPVVGFSSEKEQTSCAKETKQESTTNVKSKKVLKISTLDR